MSAHSAEENEQNIVTVEGDGRTVVFKQIAGPSRAAALFSISKLETT